MEPHRTYFEVKNNLPPLPMVIYAKLLRFLFFLSLYTKIIFSHDSVTIMSPESLKHLSFVMLVIQNTALGIVSKYSRLVSGPKYKPGTVILLVEVLKFLLCFLIELKVHLLMCKILCNFFFTHLVYS
jgi:hypothetical protein